MKINIRDYDNIYFGSDLHLFHDKEFLWGPRGFKNASEHTEGLINGINNQVSQDSLIILLGDLCLTCTYEDMLKSLQRIVCKNIWMIIGNHDTRIVKFLDRQSAYKTLECVGQLNITDQEESLMYDKNIKDLSKFHEITIHEPSKIKNQKDICTHITLCHYPLSIWNHSHRGSISLCGHSHGNFNETSVEFPFVKRLDVGVENAMKYSGNVLFTFQEIKDIMDRKLIDIKDHHGRNNENNKID